MRGNFVRRRFQMAVVSMGPRWLARVRREDVRRAGFSRKVGELPYGLGLGK